MYEDCLGNCDYCGRDGVAGDTLKLFEYAEEAGLASPKLGTEYYLRCADRTMCKVGAASPIAASAHGDDAS